MGAGAWHEGGEPGNELHRVEHDMSHPVIEGGLESIHDLPAAIDREAFVRDCRAGDVAMMWVGLLLGNISARLGQGQLFAQRRRYTRWSIPAEWPCDLRFPQSYRAMRLASVCLLLICATGLFLAGCSPGTKVDGFDVVVGFNRSTSDLRPCGDYGSSVSYNGRPYYVRIPETGRVIRRHEGMDFCGTTGTKVIAASNGRVVNIVRDNPYRGGSVIIETDFKASSNGGANSVPKTVYLFYVHITPDPELRRWKEIKAGDFIGTLQPPGKPEIGPLSHVHFATGVCSRPWNCHIDPNRFWQNGPGIVTCFDPKNPTQIGKLVAPLRC